MARAVFGFLLLWLFLHGSVRGQDNGISQCTNGFLSIDSLLAVSNLRMRNRAQRVIPSMNFSCDGAINKWIVRARWNISGTEFPDLQLWRNSSGNGVYTKVGNTTLFASAENSSSVYELEVQPSLPFQRGDILGIFQARPSRSRLRIYYRNGTGNPLNFVFRVINTVTEPPFESFTTSSSGIIRQTVLPLVTVEISRHMSSGTMPLVTVTASARLSPIATTPSLSTSVQDSSISASARLSPTTTTPSLSTSVQDSPISASTRLSPTTTTPSLSTSVQDSPISASARLSPTTTTPSLSTSVQHSSISASARLSMPTTTPSLSTPAIILQDSSIATSVRQLPTTIVPSSTGDSSIAARNTLSPTTTTPSSSTPVIILEAESSMSGVLTTALPQPSSRSGNTDESFPAMTAGIATGVVGGSLLAMFIVLIVVAVFLLIIRRKRKYSLPAGQDHHCNHALDNPLYGHQGQYVHGGDRYAKVAELNAKIPSGEYELVRGPEDMGLDFSNPLYAEQEREGANALYESTHLDAETLEWGLYVPTEEQRRKLSSSADLNESGLYSTVYSDINTCRDTVHRPAKEQDFFQECNIYWVPSSDPTELYAQLAQYKFREILRHQIKTTEHLGSGQFGNVEKGVWSSPRGPVDVAVKQLNEGVTESDRVKFLKEAAIMGQFQHPHVIKLHGVVTVGEPVMIVLEFMPNGDLRDFLIQSRPSPGEMTAPETPKLCPKLSCQVASGMEYLANKSFVHRDLAARNILVSAEMDCKIADFGMARDLEDSEYYVSHGGKIPVKWTAPEAINFKKYSIASDVWSFGAVLFEIWSLGHKPFEGYTNYQVLHLVGDGYRLSPPPGCPRAVYKLMAQCWHLDTESRPTFSELRAALSQPETELLGWSEKDKKVHPQAAVLGAPLESGKDLYLELQEMYISRCNK